MEKFELLKPNFWAPLVTISAPWQTSCNASESERKTVTGTGNHNGICHLFPFNNNNKRSFDSDNYSCMSSSASNAFLAYSVAL